MHHSHLIIDTARSLYIKHRGEDHRRIEREMHALGCLSFTRRVFYNQKTKRGTRLGWIEKYGWKDQLSAGNEGALACTDAASAFDQSPPSSIAARPPYLRELSAGNAGALACTDAASASMQTPPSSTAALPPYLRKSSAFPARPGIVFEAMPPSSPTRQAAQSSSLEDRSVLAPSIAPFPSWLKRIAPKMTWHWRYQQFIYDQLERVTSGECKRLMIFLPPRHGKSELVSNRYAAWRLHQKPQTNIILGSYNQRLADRFSRKIRITFDESLHLSEPPASAGGLTHPNDRSEPPASAGGLTQRYGKSEPDTGALNTNPRSAIRTPQLTRPLNSVSEWETGLGGGVRAVGVGGGITGYGADLVIIDDPIKSRAEAESKTYRDKTYEWFNDDLYTRLEPNAAIILIQTRWHEDDLAGRLLKEMEDGGEHWDVISFPAIAEDPNEINKPDEEPEKKEPILLASDGSVIPPPPRPFHDRLYYNRAEWDEYEPKLAEYERLLKEQQQREEKEAQRLEQWKRDHPQPVDVLGRFAGEALCRERFTETELERIKRRLGTYSFSALYQQRPTPPEGGLFKRKWFSRIVDKRPVGLKWCRAYDLAISVKNTADYTATVRCALDKRTGELYIADGFRARMEFPEQKRLIFQKMWMERNTEHGIELAMHGLAFVQELRRDRRLFGCAFRGIQVKADKFTRALAWANLAEEGKVILVRGPWIEQFLEEVTTFPNSRHDDQIDAVSLAVQMLHSRKHFAYAF